MISNQTKRMLYFNFLIFTAGRNDYRPMLCIIIFAACLCLNSWGKWRVSHCKEKTVDVFLSQPSLL